jgi:hypothetical protein
MSDRFYPRAEPSSESRGAKIKSAIYGPTSAMLNVLASTPLPRADDATGITRVIADMLAPASGKSSRLLAHQLNSYSLEQARAMGPEFLEQWKAARATSASTAPAPAPALKVAATPAPAPAPKPMPVPADVEARGPEFVRGYRDGFRKETRRCLALLAHPAATGRHIAVGQLASQGLDDAQIIARLPKEATDIEQRARMRQAEISAMWDRAYARASGQPVPTPYSSAEVGDVWDKAIALNNPGHMPAASPSSASGDAWDRAYARVFSNK